MHLYSICSILDASFFCLSKHDSEASCRLAVNAETLRGSAAHFKLCLNLKNWRENRVPELASYCCFFCHIPL